MNGLLVGGVIGEGLKSFVNSYNATQDRQRQQAESDETRAMRRRQMKMEEMDRGVKFNPETDDYDDAYPGRLTKYERQEIDTLNKAASSHGDAWGRKEFDPMRNRLKELLTKSLGAQSTGMPSAAPTPPQQPMGIMNAPAPQQPAKGFLPGPAPMKKAPTAIAPKMPATPMQNVEPVDEYEKMAREVETAPIPGYNPSEFTIEPKWVREEKINRAKRAQEIRLKGKEKGVNQATDGQANAAGFASRVEEANSIFDELEGGGFDRADARYDFQEDVASIPLIGKYTRGAQDPRLLRQSQAERNFINAVLRRESGASIAPSEFESAELQYFPRTGDTPEVKAQKKQNRITALANLRAGAGDKAMGKMQKERAALGQGAPTQKPQSAKPAPGSLITHRNGKVFRLAPDGDTLIEVK